MLTATHAAPRPALTRQPALALFAGLIALEAFILLLPGHLAVNAHEVDVLHAANAVLRIVAGERQHIDFLTPLGPLSFYPVAWFVEAGLALPRAFVAVNVAVALCLLPVLVRIAASRLPGALGLAFGGYVIVLSTAVVYGGDQANISISMAYNRWAWAVSFMMLVLLVVPPVEGASNRRLDGAIIGLCLGALALLKVTFFVAFAPIAVVGLAQRRDVPGSIWVMAAGLWAASFATLFFGGMPFWLAYLDNLQTIAAHNVRPHPGLELQSLMAGPSYFPTILCLLALVVGLRHCGAEGPGLLVLLLLPACVFVTYQNWGNDPKWVVLVAVLALAFRGRLGEGQVFGAPPRQFLAYVALAAVTLGASSVLNMAISPARNLAASEDAYMPMLLAPRHSGLWVERARSFNGEGTSPLGPLQDPASDAADAPAASYVLGNTEIPRCVMATGYFGKMRELARRLEAAGHGGRALAFVDVTNPLHLIGDFAPVPGEAPWYYGGTQAALAADGLVVPTCGISNNTAAHYLAALNRAADWRLVERDAHYLLFEQVGRGL